MKNNKNIMRVLQLLRILKLKRKSQQKKTQLMLYSFLNFFFIRFLFFLPVHKLHLSSPAKKQHFLFFSLSRSSIQLQFFYFVVLFICSLCRFFFFFCRSQLIFDIRVDLWDEHFPFFFLFITTNKTKQLCCNFSFVFFFFILSFSFFFSSTFHRDLISISRNKKKMVKISVRFSLYFVFSFALFFVHSVCVSSLYCLVFFVLCIFIVFFCT
jgi:hypothetical protein